MKYIEITDNLYSNTELLNLLIKDHEDLADESIEKDIDEDIVDLLIELGIN